MRIGNRSNSGIGLTAMAVFLIAGFVNASPDEHAHHRKAMQSADLSVTTASYDLPDVQLVDETGGPVRVRELLSGDRPLAVNFIFTSCTTICPVMTATMLQLQSELVDDGVRPAYVSISIDPDYDSASVMKSYAERYGADWTFLTGSPRDVMQVLKSFDAYRGSKINHFALTLMTPGDDAEWIRIEGLTSAKHLAEIWRQITS